MWLLGSTHQLSIPTLNSCMKGSELLYIDCSQSAKHLRLDLKITFKKVKWFLGIGMGWEKVVIIKYNYKWENENFKDRSVSDSLS